MILYLVTMKLVQTNYAFEHLLASLDLLFKFLTENTLLAFLA
jgi:hypothetical protein